MKRSLTQFLAGERGQMMPALTLISAIVLTMGGLSIDLGHAFICKRELQASADAAALAAAYALTATNATVSSVQAEASLYSSATGSKNANPAFNTVSITTTPECLTTVASWGALCTGSTTGDNAVQVLEVGTINTWFIRMASIFGVNSAQTMTIEAESTAAMRGSINAQYNVAIVVDTTASMGNSDTDASCNNKRIYCALQGVQVLLKSLSPCTPASASGTCVPFDQVSLFTFPNVQASDNSKKTSYSTNDTTCPTSNPTIPYYSTPAAGAKWSAPTTGGATYQITSFLSDYSSTNLAGGALNASSALAIAAGASGVKNCSGLQTPGGDGTYLAGSVYAAQSALIAAQNANPGSLNAMIILSDGAANTTKMTSGAHNGNTYPSLDYQCTQSINAAKAATAAGTTVYTVAYGASTAKDESQCTTDPSLSPCSELQQMASTSGDFYSDATASQNKGQCTSASNPNLNLSQIFKQISTQFTVTRIIPNNTQ
jgi:Flp pilus assembly protein TadG